MSFTNVVLMGNLTRDVELRHLQDGKAVTDVGVAVNEWSGGGEKVSFYDVTLWGKDAETAASYLGKGSPVIVRGRLQQDTWEKDGQKRSMVKIVCDRLQLVPRGGQRQEEPQMETAGSSEEIPF